MRILHYSLGFPPYRTGGLTKFTMDLMRQQEKDGHIVTLLWPGNMHFIGKSTAVKYKGNVDGIQSYEVINPVPISYDEGIIDTILFMELGDADVYEKFLMELKPDVIHIHTLMGFHKNFLIVAKKLNIRTCFSVHDFFPICPKVTMYRNGKLCDTITDCSMCNICNKTALSINKIRILQNPIYRVMKNSHIVKLLRKSHRDNFLGENVSTYDKDDTSLESRNYIKLREFYKSVISNMDMIHYNSTITKNVYEKYMGVYKSFIIPISHADIKDNRKRREYNDCLKLSYLGPYGGAKGFFFLRRHLMNY